MGTNLIKIYETTYNFLLQLHNAHRNPYAFSACTFTCGITA